MIKLEETPKSVEKAYRFTNRLRMVTMFLSYGFTVLLFILFIKLDESVLESLGAAVVFGSTVHGFVHLEFLFRKIIGFFEKIGLTKIPGVMACAFVWCCFGQFVGIIYTVIDSILFFRKKSLIYPFEVKCFFESDKVQEEMYQMELEHQREKQEAIYDSLQESAVAKERDAIMENIQTLKKMYDDGVIKEEDFNRKKAELLEKI